MSYNIFFKFVEIQTKVASMFPLALGVLFSAYRYNSIKWGHVALMFFSLLCIDFATTGLNNLMDYKRAIKKEGYGYEVHNVMGSGSLSETQAYQIIVSLILLAIVSGITLALHTDWIVLIVGISSFLVAIFYSWGPMPISRTPLGEVFSGFFMGFLIFFLGAYINIYDLGLIVLQFSGMDLHFVMDIKEVVILFVASIPLIVGIANIMLANNICDMAEDIENKRHTLPTVVGKEMALRIFSGLYVIAYLSWIFMIFMRWVPYMSAIALLTAFPVFNNIKSFNQLQEKAKTFVLAVQNFVLMSSAYLISIGLGIAVKYIF